MGGVLAHGWNFWESAPVNTRGCAVLKTQANRATVPPLVACSHLVHMELCRRSRNSELDKQEKDEEGFSNCSSTPPARVVNAVEISQAAFSE